MGCMEKLRLIRCDELSFLFYYFVEVTSTADSTPSLEEIQLDEDHLELESFLADENLEGTDTQTDSIVAERD